MKSLLVCHCYKLFHIHHTLKTQYLSYLRTLQQTKLLSLPMLHQERLKPRKVPKKTSTAKGIVMTKSTTETSKKGKTTGLLLIVEI